MDEFPINFDNEIFINDKIKPSKFQTYNLPIEMDEFTINFDNKITNFINESDYISGSEYINEYNYINDEYSSPSANFQLLFINDDIDIFKRLARDLEPHFIFWELINNMKPLLIPEFDRIFEQKLVMYISINIKNRNPTVGSYIMTKDNIIYEINNLVQETIDSIYSTFPTENSVKFLLDGYPLLILTNICNSCSIHAHTMGESIRKFIEKRNTHPGWFPKELINITNGNTPLTGYSSSPLNNDELEALYRYVGSRKNIYIHMLLNALFELSEHSKLLQEDITEDTISIICKSSWLYLLLSFNNNNT